MPRFGLQLASFLEPDFFTRATVSAATAEQAGFDSLWVMDHFHQLPPMMARDAPMPEAYTTLAALAAVTERIELGALVTGITYRNPALLAKMATTLDVISGGRAWLGVGASWNEDEFHAYGFGDELPSIKERLDRLEETLQILRGMMRETESSFSGAYYRTRGALNIPPPVRDGGPPILIGGSGEKRLLKLVATYGDACNLFGDPATVRQKLEVLDQHCRAVRRDPEEIEGTHLGGLVVGENDADAAKIRERFLSQSQVEPEFFDGFFTVGGPERVRDQVAELIDAGLEHLMFFDLNGWEPEYVMRAGETLAPLR
ncbi:MAG: TIGR03560 family F420-dependent LLM class oxidoreductase [Thermoleophilia bacterium]|nr:TIGR03560 family F420-dependent LLM class oxidoreductase [Thermoleophilia bacterium]MDH3724571.1 TIGR03560 family F420-dependent LLM class oxidoreductase [Thermoleophilia bacterium]